ncbi:MAG: DUF6502 family protein [Burkholderiales bacterium]|nr:DUF6502 family protein [Burkholderiales bacterium]
MTSEADPSASALQRAVLRVMRALARVLIRNGLTLPAFVELAKRAWVDVALGDFTIPGRKPSISRASLLTGLTRKDVQRLVDARRDADAEAALAVPDHRAARVIAGWIHDADYGDAGAPRDLAFDGEGAGFSTLVRRYGGDVPPRAVLDELLQVGNVERLEDGRLRLLTRFYLPRSNDAARLGILGTDVAWLIGTIDHNLQGRAPPRFQRKVTYDNLPVEAVDAFRTLSAQHAQALIELLGDWLARHDRDTNPAVEGSGRMRAGVGVFYFEEDLEDRSEGDRP